MANTKNYGEQGGDKWVVGGILEVTPDGLILLEEVPLKRAEMQTESKATTISGLTSDFNNLLAKLKTAGLMKTQ